MEDNKDYQTTRIKKKTLDKLRLLAALTHETQIQVIERLVNSELEKLSRDNPSLNLLSIVETA